MSRIMVLDCTLRDGGYCNQWRFGYENAKQIMTNLSEANMDIIECGFLTNRVVYDENVTKYTDVYEIEKMLPLKKRNNIFVLMINFGEYDLEELPEKTENGIDGIRLAFHKKDVWEAMRLAKRIKEKGYLLFLQPMVTLSYTDAEFLSLIEKANALKPYAFYIVDSFGTMKRHELSRLFYLVDYKLIKDIVIGFHSHNNMQLAYANAQMLVDAHAEHDIIIDSSVYGMGRGAGNLNTELFIGYLNDNFGTDYKIQPLLNIIDDVLDTFYKQNYWGYSLPNYLSALYGTHPNYAGYLCDKNSLNVEDMDAILAMMDDEKRVYFDKEYIENLYVDYLSAGETYGKHKEKLEKELNGRKILLIAPGRSSYEQREKIREYARRSNVCVISVNHEYTYVKTDFIFLSNLRRYRELEAKEYSKCITTSNIPTSQVYFQYDYRKLLNNNEQVKDNAGLMAVKFLMIFKVSEIVMAGFDGYSHDSSENYSNESLLLITKKAFVDAMNRGMSDVLADYMKKCDIKFVTPPKYLDIKENHCIFENT